MTRKRENTQMAGLLEKSNKDLKKSEEKSSKPSVSKTVYLSKMKKKGQITIGPSLTQEVLYLLTRRPSKEWSGALFWKLNKGANLEKPETISIKVDHLFLNDLGNSTYTEFEHDDVAGHIMDNEHLMDYRVGLIHSHHTMAAFFSGTDTEELHEKAADGLYLSLIVNNHMQPVCKLAWMGQIERKIETFNSWDLGVFVRKPKRAVKTELANVFYEIEMEINFHDSISAIADRYNELEEEENIVTEGRKISRQMGHQKSFFESNKEEDYYWDQELRSWEPKAGVKDDKADTDASELFIQNLQRKGILEQCFAAVITQNPKTNFTLTQALDDAMKLIREDVQTLDDENSLPAHDDYMTTYAKVAKEHAELVIINGDDLLTEKLDEFYIDDADYYAFLGEMYNALAKSGETILCKELKQAIVAITLADEEEEEDEKDEKEAIENDIPNHMNSKVGLMGGLL